MLEVGLGCGMEVIRTFGRNGRGRPGGSVKIWRRVFPPPFELELHVLEYNRPCGEHYVREQEALGLEPRVTVHYGDQSNPAVLNNVYRKAGAKPFDIIVEDGSHLSSHQIATLEHVFAHDFLRPNGVYFLEDIQGSCTNWTLFPVPADYTGPTAIDGTKGCLETQFGQPTMLKKIFDWQKSLAVGNIELPGVRHIDVFQAAAVFQRSGKVRGPTRGLPKCNFHNNMCGQGTTKDE